MANKAGVGKAVPSELAHPRGEELRTAGITEELVRISIGTEHWRDLLDDFTRALESV